MENKGSHRNQKKKSSSTSAMENSSTISEHRSSEQPPSLKPELYLPEKKIKKIMAKMLPFLPPGSNISNETIMFMQECTSEYIRRVSGEAFEHCQKEKRNMVTGDDLLFGIEKLGLGHHAQMLSTYMQQHRDRDRDHSMGLGSSAGQRVDLIVNGGRVGVAPPTCHLRNNQQGKVVNGDGSFQNPSLVMNKGTKPYDSCSQGLDLNLAYNHPDNVNSVFPKDDPRGKRGETSASAFYERNNQQHGKCVINGANLYRIPSRALEIRTKHQVQSSGMNGPVDPHVKRSQTGIFNVPNNHQEVKRVKRNYIEPMTTENSEGDGSMVIDEPPIAWCPDGGMVQPKSEKNV
ncbi:hypothetical protein AQUCO_00500329v1 [Aquilegia coerulea]|uniref:Transcription factor CBF/NF-Y/archaeal histone domain-containing protein n=1 Tax=Aquilegia coerulea TaxID=218851 RepID=A0A2G5ERG1_AQUCA|nr:hypothetical protein AQUCO_00500329v1 [Aquilegia coerulea]